jgi:hypothetical protein
MIGALPLYILISPAVVVCNFGTIYGASHNSTCISWHFSSLDASPVQSIFLRPLSFFEAFLDLVFGAWRSCWALSLVRFCYNSIIFMLLELFYSGGLLLLGSCVDAKAAMGYDMLQRCLLGVLIF